MKASLNELHFMWVPVTKARRVLGLRLGKTASRYSVLVRMYWISSHGQPIRGGQAWVLGGWLTTPHLKNQLVTIFYIGFTDLTDCCEHGNEPSDSMKGRKFFG